MDHLFLLQFACFLFMLFNAFTLAVTRLQTRWLNPRYERARWLIFVGIMGLAAHYLMQMRYGFRAVDDAVGATVNALVYAPCFSLISMGIFHIEATHVRRRRVYVVCATINLAIFACFFIGFLQHGEMRIGAWLYAMLALFAANVVYCIVVIVREIIKRRRLLETMAGGDIMPYVRYSRASLLILFFPAVVSPFAIISTKLLYFFAPLGLMAFLFFILSFVALGYSYQPKESLLDEEAEGKVSPAAIVASRRRRQCSRPSRLMVSLLLVSFLLVSFLLARRLHAMGLMLAQLLPMGLLPTRLVPMRLMLAQPLITQRLIAHLMPTRPMQPTRRRRRKLPR